MFAIDEVQEFEQDTLDWLLFDDYPVMPAWFKRRGIAPYKVSRGNRNGEECSYDWIASCVTGLCDTIHHNAKVHRFNISKVEVELIIDGSHFTSEPCLSIREAYYEAYRGWRIWKGEED